MVVLLVGPANPEEMEVLAVVVELRVLVKILQVKAELVEVVVLAPPVARSQALAVKGV